MPASRGEQGGHLRRLSIGRGGARGDERVGRVVSVVSHIRGGAGMGGRPRIRDRAWPKGERARGALTFPPRLSSLGEIGRLSRGIAEPRGGVLSREAAGGLRLAELAESGRLAGG